ncbi:IS1 family transposase [Methylobacter sp. sgz302048]|uniref:IS1 family transposase n=1 Tax=Methylobacter sp. sgz302048 TaxID=3455945 RepID=UPI003F9F9E1C
MAPENREIIYGQIYSWVIKNLNFRTWVKRLARKTIGFSKLEVLHDTVIGLLINKVEFGVDIHA